MTETDLIQVRHLTYRYGQRPALKDVDFSIRRGEIFGFLGPNGSGKTTLFRILSTLLAVPAGATVKWMDQDLATAQSVARAQTGVVFQSNSLDLELTVFENLRHQGYLYGLHGAPLERRIDDLLERFSLTDRRHEPAGKLSGGLRRRVELAKSFLHSPLVLLLDEPSAGLDPAARKDLWQYLTELRMRDEVTIVLTTHILEEAEYCDRLALLDEGRLVAVETPQVFRASIGGDIITVRSPDPESLCAAVKEQFGGEPRVLESFVRLERKDGHEFIPTLVKAFPELIASVSLGRPTLEDVFIARTGHGFVVHE